MPSRGSRYQESPLYFDSASSDIQSDSVTTPHSDEYDSVSSSFHTEDGWFSLGNTLYPHSNRRQDPKRIPHVKWHKQGAWVWLPKDFVPRELRKQSPKTTGRLYGGSGRRPYDYNRSEEDYSSRHPKHRRSRDYDSERRRTRSPSPFVPATPSSSIENEHVGRRRPRYEERRRPRSPKYRYREKPCPHCGSHN